jgi:hypothetical protein
VATSSIFTCSLHTALISFSLFANLNLNTTEHTAKKASTSQIQDGVTNSAEQDPFCELNSCSASKYIFMEASLMCYYEPCLHPLDPTASRSLADEHTWKTVLLIKPCSKNIKCDDVDHVILR